MEASTPGNIIRSCGYRLQRAMPRPATNRSGPWRRLEMSRFGDMEGEWSRYYCQPTVYDLDVLHARHRASVNPDEVRTFSKGKFEMVHIAGRGLGRATCEPGWRWSEDVGRA
jgi:hypothetical protein